MFACLAMAASHRMAPCLAISPECVLRDRYAVAYETESSLAACIATQQWATGQEVFNALSTDDYRAARDAFIATMASQGITITYEMIADVTAAAFAGCAGNAARLLASNPNLAFTVTFNFTVVSDGVLAQNVRVPFGRFQVLNWLAIPLTFLLCMICTLLHADAKCSQLHHAVRSFCRCG